MTTFAILAALLIAFAAWLFARSNRRWAENTWRPEVEESFNFHRRAFDRVRRFVFIAHDGTRVVIWDVSRAQADLRFERSKWGGKPKKIVDEECKGR